MRLFSLMGLCSLFFVSACQTYDSSKPRPHYFYAYNCYNQASCYDAATIKCKRAGANKKPSNMSLQRVYEHEDTPGFLGGRRYKSSYEARFTCS